MIKEKDNHMQKYMQFRVTQLSKYYTTVYINTQWVFPFPIFYLYAKQLQVMIDIAWTLYGAINEYKNISAIFT